MKVSLVPEAKHWWRMWSVRFDAIMYAIMAYFLANPAEVGKIVAFVPESIRPIAAIVLPVALYVLKTGSRVMNQPTKARTV